MASTKKLEWWIDEQEYHHFREFVEEKHGVIDLCFPSEVVQAMRAFIDKDRAADVEDELRELEDVVADSFDGYSRRRTSFGSHVSDDFGSGETVKIRCEVPAILKEEFSIYIDENSEWGYGEALARAMNAYRDGGREQRLADRLAEITDTLQNDEPATAESDTDAKPYSVEDKLAAIRSDLADSSGVDSADEIAELTRADLVDPIHDYCAKGDNETASDRTVSDYIERITADLNLTQHPMNDRLYIKDADLDGPAFEYREYADLSTGQRVEAVRVKLLKKAKARGYAQATAATIRDEFFDGAPSESVAHDLRDRAAECEGFGRRTSEGGENAVKVDVVNVVDETLLKAADIEPPSEIEAEADAEMAAIMEAQVVTDGGRDIPKEDRR